MTPTKTVDETVWTRAPFSLSEQLKILLIFVDGLPFRSTQQNYPNRLDVGEASDLCEWSERHLHLLIHRAIELDLIRADDERFFMTERVEDWEDGELDTTLEESTLPPYWDIADGPTSPEFRDDNLVVESIMSLLKLLERDRSAQPVDSVLMKLRDQTKPATLFDDVDREIDESALDVTRMAHDLGFVDVLYEDDAIEKVKLNDRGDHLVSGTDTETEITDREQDLPIILQPDGRMMLPLESPLSDFRRIHPFVLLTGIDNMIEYNIDRRSLVKAENEGWDTTAFRNFLREQTGTIPETVQALFEETKGDAEEVRIEDVNHLLTFEEGATAAEAMRILSNYQPERIDERRLLLRSSSSSDTIKKNLSRAGIRIQMATGRSRDASPVKSVPDDGDDSSDD